jgi:hypothetical protein
MVVTLPSGTDIALTEIFSFKFDSGHAPSDASVSINLLSGGHVYVHGESAERIFRQINLAKELCTGGG